MRRLSCSVRSLSSLALCSLACIDDGLAYTHIDIKDNAWKNPNSAEPDQFGYNFYDDVPSPEPIYFKPPFDQMAGNDIHGTACAGVICAAEVLDRGVYGIAPRCKVIGVKIFGGDDIAPPFRIAEAIRYAGSHADILSCSWSSGSPNDTIIHAIRDVTRTGRNGKGCSVFVATGNDFADRISFPANIPETIAVGASTNEGKKAPYSNSGPEIDFVAPSSGGTRRIFTTDVPYENRGFNVGKPGQGDPQGLYTSSFGGTSSATPLAAGIGALVLSINSNLTGEQVRQILKQPAIKLILLMPTTTRMDLVPTYGHGRLNAKCALELANSGDSRSMSKFIVRITARSYEQLRSLDKYQLDLKKRTARLEGTDKFIVTGILTEEQINQVKAAGYTVEILSDLSHAGEERTQEVSKTNRFISSKKTSELRESAELGGYMNADEVETALVNLRDAHQDIITLIELPNRTHEGRLCRAVHVHAGGNNNSSRGVLVTGGVHAREWGGSDIRSRSSP